jgi:hypothetical protein
MPPNPPSWLATMTAPQRQALVGTVMQQPEAQKVLLSSSDLPRVKITRHDAKTGKNHEWILNCKSAVNNRMATTPPVSGCATVM